MSADGQWTEGPGPRARYLRRWGVQMVHRNPRWCSPLPPPPPPPSSSAAPLRLGCSGALWTWTQNRRVTFNPRPNPSTRPRPGPCPCVAVVRGAQGPGPVDASTLRSHGDLPKPVCLSPRPPRAWAAPHAPTPPPKPCTFPLRSAASLHRVTPGHLRHRGILQHRVGQNDGHVRGRGVGDAPRGGVCPLQPIPRRACNM